MKLAFNGQARYPDFESGYNLYVKRSRTRECVDKAIYKTVVKEYCRSLVNRLEETGMVDLPQLGSITAAFLIRKPQYRGKTFVGYGKMDWEKGHYDGEPKAFGLVFLPDRRRSENLRSYGFVANRKLFKRMKELYLSGCPWYPIEFSDEII